MTMIVPCAGGTGRMRRVPEVLSELLDHLDRHSAAMDEQRLGARRAVQGPVAISPCGGAGRRTDRPDGVWIGDDGAPQRLHGWALDISEAGIGLLIEQPLPGGSIWQVNLQALAGRPLFIAVRVIYCQQLLPSAYRVGGLFVEPQEP